MALTDDYLVLFDRLEGKEEHRFTSLLQLKGFRGIEGAYPARHTEQLSENIRSDGQFITDVNWYRAEAGTKASFEQIFTEDDAGELLRGDRTNHNIPGKLYTDVYTAWPPETTQFVGRVAVYDGWPASGNGYTIPLAYRVEGDGRVLREGSFNGWILGRGEIDEDISGLRELKLFLKQGESHDELGKPVKTPQGCFWGEILLEMDDGSAVNIGELLKEKEHDARSETGDCPKDSLDCEMVLSLENVDMGEGVGRDYRGGRVTIIGTEYPSAIPASPVNHDRESVITICLPQGAARLKACVGVDAFAGDEDARRKTYGVQTTGSRASFITVIEPYEAKEKRVIDRVEAIDEHTVLIRRADGQSETVIFDEAEGKVHMHGGN